MCGPTRGWIAVIAGVVSIGSASNQQSPTSPSPAWPQWGGPDRNFVSSATGLASSWPIAGPRKLWSRPLGEGHSAISGDGTRLYTLYRPLHQGSHADQEVVAALDAKTGAAAWAYTFPSPMEGAKFGEYVGPHSTPLVTANRVYAAGSRKQVLALNKADGTLLWSHDLIREYGAPEGDRGYAASPLLYIGTGNIAWQDRSFARSQLVYADGKLLVLDEEGHLGLVTVGPKGLQILGKAQILESVAWTPPTLIDTTLFVRDRKTIAAYSLAK